MQLCSVSHLGKLFFSGGNDDNLRTRIINISETLQAQQRARDAAKDQAINYYTLYAYETTAHNMLDGFLAQAQTNFDMASNEYNDLMGSRQAADQTVESIKLLCWDIENSQDSATLDACLKHVLHLLKTMSPPLDQVPAVVAAKQAIEAQIKGAVGGDKFEELDAYQKPLPAADF